MECHYEVRITNIKYTSKSEMDFDYSVKKFTDNNPIHARKEAFKFSEDYLASILERLGYEYVSDDDTRKILEHYIYNPNADGLIINNDKESEDSTYLFFGIAVFFVNDRKDNKKEKEAEIEAIENTELKTLLKSLNEHPEITQEQLIYGIGYYGARKIDTRNFIDDLWFEYMAYDGNEIDVSDVKIKINYCDEDSDEAEEIEILSTPFNWSIFENPVIKKEASVTIRDIKIDQLLNGGETDQVEFKSSLVYNFKSHEGGIGVKAIIAKCICAFLNSNGGFLLIGVTDEGKAQGLEYDYSLSDGVEARDFFRLQFDSMIEHFLPHWVFNYISMSIIAHNDVDICVVTVSPSKKEPAFLNAQLGKEFYIRRTASTKSLNIEEFYNYYRNHWLS